MNQPQAIARILLQHKAVFLSPEAPFTWTSGIKSPVYCDNRILISSVGAREEIIQAFCKIISPYSVDLIAGTATAAIPWAAWVADRLKLPLVYVRSSSKEHGRKNSIEGKIHHGTRTILIEDLISTGKSSIAAAQKLIEADVEVIKIVSIFTYGLKMTQSLFAQANLSYESISDFDVLVQVAYDNRILSELTRDQLLDWKRELNNHE
jgi:orotate phosphoribosyltransferase